MSSYNAFAKQYAESMGKDGDYFHQTQIDPYVYEVVGDPKGKTIYDIGCGNGYMARHFAGLGATVFASDLSDKLITIAKEKSKNLDIHFQVHDASDFSHYQDQQFDVVVMNMVIHYIQNLDSLFEGIARVLKPQGILAFSTNHFFRPPYPYSEWVPGKVDDEEKLFIKVTGYLEKRVTTVTSAWDGKTQLTLYNHPLSELINTMAQHGLYTFQIHEPESVGFAKDFGEALQKSHHIPTFMTIGAKKVR